MFLRQLWNSVAPDWLQVAGEEPQQEHKANGQLEPMSTLIRLAMLQYLPAGTKLGVEGNAIVFDRPVLGQAALRTWRGSSREDVHCLNGALKTVLRVYNARHPHVRLLLAGAAHGLAKFAQCYNGTSNLTATSLEYYQTMLRNALRPPMPSVLAAALRAKRRCPHNDDDRLDGDDDSSAQDDDDDCVHVSGRSHEAAWSASQIAIMHDMFRELERQQHSASEVEGMLAAIENLLQPKRGAGRPPATPLAHA
jgi:hypothetical protein